jgi:hypothetical protein
VLHHLREVVTVAHHVAAPALAQHVAHLRQAKDEPHSAAGYCDGLSSLCRPTASVACSMVSARVASLICHCSSHYNEANEAYTTY